MADPTPDTARRYTKTVADLYAEATVELLRAIAKRAERGLDDTAQRAKLADVLALREQARGIASRLSDTVDDQLAGVIGDAYTHGAGQGTENLHRLLGFRDNDTDRAAQRGLAATKRTTVEALAGRLSGRLADLPILRATEDAYTRAIAASVVPAAAGVETRRQATQRALDRLATEGLGGFVDQSGRRWRLESYAEMATRSTVAQAALQGSVDRIRETTPFVRVADSSDECDLCRPWEGAILLTTSVDEIPDRWRGQRYDGTLRDATSAGLFHPNCTHAVGAFIPGLTRDREQRPAAENPQGYADRQEQRRLERQVRAWKRHEAVALDPVAQRKAAAKVAEYQQRIAEHVARTNRPRRRDREQLPRLTPPTTRGPVDLPDMPSTSPSSLFPDPVPDPAGRTFDVTTPPVPVPVVVPVVELTDAALEAEVAQLMAANDYGARFDDLAAELDRRDAEANRPPVEVPDEPDALAEQEALQRLLFGTAPTRDLTQARAPRTVTAAEREKELRDEYFAWLELQYAAGEARCRGGDMLSLEGQRRGINVMSLFDGTVSLKWASSELQEWFAEPGNKRMSFPEYRASLRDDKKAREAGRRYRNRGYESEYG